MRDIHPDLEDHPYIRSLIERQEKRTRDRNIHHDRHKANEERDKEIYSRKPVDIVEFYCDWCDEDFAQIAYRQVEVDWSNSRQHIAYYKTKHDCGNWCIRHITDRFNDIYWSSSRQVANDRGKHHADLLQPFESNYELLYGRKNK